MASFTIRKRTVNVFKTGHLRQYTVNIRTENGPYYIRLTFFLLRLYPISFEPAEN